MLLQIFLRSFGIPILLLIAIMTRSGEAGSMEVFSRWLLIISILILTLITKKRYLREMIIDEDRIRIICTSQFFKTYTIEYLISDVRKIRLSRRSWINWLWPPDLHVTTADTYRYFTVLDHKIYEQVRSQLDGVMHSVKNERS